MGKLLISHRYNRIPLLNSLPGGFYRSWSYKTYPSAKVTLFSKSAKRKRKIRKKRVAVRRICVPKQRKRQGKAVGFPRPTAFRAERERSYLARHSGVPDDRTALRAGRSPAQTGGTSAKPQTSFAFALGLHALRRTSLRLDRRRLGKTANFVCFCARLARFAGTSPA